MKGDGVGERPIPDRNGGRKNTVIDTTAEKVHAHVAGHLAVEAASLVSSESEVAVEQITEKDGAPEGKDTRHVEVESKKMGQQIDPGSINNGNFYPDGGEAEELRCLALRVEVGLKVTLHESNGSLTELLI